MHQRDEFTFDRPSEVKKFQKMLAGVTMTYGGEVYANYSGETPLHLAALAGNTVAIEWLLNPANCSIDPNLENKHACNIFRLFD